MAQSAVGRTTHGLIELMQSPVQVSGVSMGCMELLCCELHKSQVRQAHIRG